MQLRRIGMMSLVAVGWFGMSCGATSDGGLTTTSSEPAAPSTTVPDPTTTTETRAATAPTDEERVVAVFEAYMGVEFDEMDDGYGPSEERIEKYTTGALRERSLKTLEARREAQAFLVGGTRWRIESVSVVGGEASIVVCIVFDTEVRSTAGDVIQADPTEPQVAEGALELTEAGWKLLDVYLGGGEACEL